MCSFADNILKTNSYINKICGLETEIHPMEKKTIGGIPIAVSAPYKWYYAEIMGHATAILLPKNEKTASPATLQKHQRIASKFLDMQILFVFSKIESYNISRMTSAMVNFVVPEKQLFFPSMLICIKKTPKNEPQEEIFMPSIAQCLILYHLQCENLNNKNTLQLSEIFKVSYPNMSKALRWLGSNAIIELSGTKTKQISFQFQGRDLWYKCEPLLRNPIERICYTDDDIKDAVIGGESALEYYSMLIAPEKKSIAISKKTAQNNAECLDKKFGDCKVEVWKYDPAIITKSKHVDKLSLYLSLKDNGDERIQKELDYLINSIEW